MGIFNIIIMKTFFAAALTAAAQASVVHPFFAERNYICELCKTAVGFEVNGEEAALEKMYEIFPAFRERIDRVGASYMEQVYDENDPKGTCEALQLCETFDMVEALRGE